MEGILILAKCCSWRRMLARPFAIGGLDAALADVDASAVLSSPNAEGRESACKESSLPDLNLRVFNALLSDTIHMQASIDLDDWALRCSPLLCVPSLFSILIPLHM